MIKGKLTIGNPERTCYVCGSGALFNVKNIKSYNEAGWGGGSKITPIPDKFLDFCFMLMQKYDLKSHPSQRVRVNGYQFHQAVRNEINKTEFKEEFKLYNGTVGKGGVGESLGATFSVHCEIFSNMLRKLVKVDKKAYYRQVASYNKRMDKRNSKPRTYPTCWYVCSEECLNMLILQKS